MDIRDKDGKTTLVDAVERGSVKCIDMSLKAGADLNIKGSMVELLYLMQSPKILLNVQIYY